MNRQSIIIALFVTCICGAALGQTDPAKLLVPFPPGQNFQMQGDGLLEDTGHIKHSDDDFRISIYESQGRYQFTNEYRINPTIGYDARVIDIKTKSDVVPGTLTDTSFSFGTPIHQFNDGWF